MSLIWDIVTPTGLRLVHRPDGVGGQPVLVGRLAVYVGDIYEFVRPPFYEIDPKTRKPTTNLQCFRIKDADLSLEPVARDSWK
jgi:hypothetical protein